MRLFHTCRLIVAAALFICPALLFADFHFDASKKDVIDAESQQLSDEITAFLKDYEAAYNNQDYRTVKSMWSKASDPIYMAEEVPFPLYGEDRMASYFNPVPGKRILDGIDNRYSEVRAKLIAPNIAVATYRLDYDIKLVGRPASYGWDRIMAVFVKEDGTWKMSAYAEAPQGPATMVRKMMKKIPAETEEEKENYAITKATIATLSERGVSEGFDEFLEARKDLEPTH